VVVFVLGIAGSGKSTFIEENYKNWNVVNVKDEQDKYVFLDYDNIMQSYIDTRDKLIKVIKNGENVVLEHTLLRAERREMYISAVKALGVPIEVFYLNKSLETLLANNEKRNTLDKNYTESSLKYQEIPTLSEGFSKITILDDSQNSIVQ